MLSRLRVVGTLCTLLVFGLTGVANAAVEGVDLTLRGQTSLPSLGQDATTKARGQNGDVSVLGDTAFVAAGSKNHGALSTPGRICTDYGGVKVVNIVNPASPTVIDQIDIADTKTILTGPKGNPRRGANVRNVASTASSVDVFHNPVANKDILAITTERCEPSFFDGARIELWDVTDPNNIPNSPIGVMDPQSIINPACIPGPCPPNTPAPDGRWGIFEDIRMFTRNNGPGGSTKVYAVATSPFSIGNTGGVSFVGDLRLIDVTNPASPQQLTSFPNSPIGQSSNNGCRTFQSARSASPTPDGSHAIVSYYDGVQPPGAPASSPIEPLRADFGSPNSAALFNIDLDQIPQYAGGVGTNADPKRFSPNPAVFGYPPAPDGGETPAGEIEGNAADVQTFVGPDGHILAIVSEEDIDPALTMLTIDAPAVATHASRGCAMLGDFTKIYLRPNQELTDDIAYVGRGCPSSPLANSTLLAADPYVQDPAGKIALFETGGDGFNGCSLARKMQRAFAAGAVGVMTNLGIDGLSLNNAGPDGGIPDIPSIGVKLAAFNKMVGSYVPNRVFTGATFPASGFGWEIAPGSLASNVAVKPLAVALGCATPVGGSPITPENCVAATNETPIKIRTATPHGLASGDRVTVAGVAGNTAANGSFTVTVAATTTPPESPAPTVFTLDGTAGNGAYTGGGYVVQCLPGEPNCAAPGSRTDISRFRSIAGAADRVAGVRVKAANRFAVVAGQQYRAGAVLEVAQYVAGAYEARVEWFDASDVSLGTSLIESRTAVTARANFAATVTAPAGATKAAMRLGWSGATAEGAAFADSFSFVPAGLHGTLKDNQGAWGEQKIVDFSVSPPAVVGTYKSPTSKQWPPPNNGVYMPREARMLDNDLAFTTWMTDGLRVLDVSAPSAPKELASFMPPAVADPSPAAGSGPSNAPGGGNMSRGASWPTQRLITGVAVRKLGANSARIVVSDINGGLSVVDASIRRTPVVTPPPAPPGTVPPPPAAPPAPPPAAADRTAARLSAFSIRPAVFRAKSSGASIAKTGGATVRYRLSEKATTTFRVERVETGRKRGTRCVRLTASNRRRAACTRYVQLTGSFRHDGLAGRVNSLRFSGRLGGRRLSAARYRLTAVTRDSAGNVGVVRRVSFRIRR